MSYDYCSSINNDANKDQVSSNVKVNKNLFSPNQHVICTCGQEQGQQAANYSSKNSKLEESQFTVIEIDGGPVLYSPPILTRYKPGNQLTRSVSESHLVQSNNIQNSNSSSINSCLRKSTSKSPSGAYKCVRFTLNPSYLFYNENYYANMDSKDRKWFDHFSQIESDNFFRLERTNQLNLNHEKKFSLPVSVPVSVKNCKKKKYLMHPSTVLLVLIFIAVILCIVLARRKRRTRVTEFNLFFALV